MTEPAVEIAGLTKTFRVGRSSVHAVDNVSFEVPTGSCLAIVGESGSGKTTTARCLMGLETASAGDIRVKGVARGRGRPSARERRRRSREMQMVFQNPYASINPRFTVHTTLKQALAVAPPGSDQPSVGELLEMVELPEALAKAHPRSLSGGQCQRVAIARALATQAEILVLDEAVAALDVSVQAQVLNLLGDLQRSRDLTMIFISHDLAAVRQIADDVLVMRGGVVVEQGTAEQVIDTPSASYTRNLVAAVPRLGWVPERGVPSHSEAAP